MEAVEGRIARCARAAERDGDNWGVETAGEAALSLRGRTMAKRKYGTGSTIKAQTCDIGIKSINCNMTRKDVGELIRQYQALPAQATTVTLTITPVPIKGPPRSWRAQVSTV